MNADESLGPELRKLVGLPGQKIFREEPAPREVDMDLLRQFHADELPRDLELEIRDLVLSYRDWNIASQRVLLDVLASLAAQPNRESATEHAKPDSISTTWIEKVIEYAQMTYRELMAELPVYSPSYRSDQLAPYMKLLRASVCEKWNWHERKSVLDGTDEVQVIAELARHLESEQISMPFPASLIAAILVKQGLDSFCAGE